MNWIVWLLKPHCCVWGFFLWRTSIKEVILTQATVTFHVGKGFARPTCAFVFMGTPTIPRGDFGVWACK